MQSEWVSNLFRAEGEENQHTFSTPNLLHIVAVGWKPCKYMFGLFFVMKRSYWAVFALALERFNKSKVLKTACDYVS